MPLICPRCSRANPDEAQYCWHDGITLGESAPNAGPVAVGSQPFPCPFYFPSGGVCRNFDELVRACDAQWDEARDLLREELLAGFFSGLGRADLAFTARKAAAEPDLDLALDRLLGQLPGEARAPARLAVRPPEVHLGRVGRGTDRRFVVHIHNDGMGVLRGSAACGGANWLVLGDDAGAPHKVFQCRHDLELPVRLVGKRVRAGGGPQDAQLLIESNGGSAVVVVRVEGPAVTPFAEGVLAGAVSPRQLADKTRVAPREAAAFFESGAVAAWYEANGWTYPVQGPAASGVAVVQQFFEALGLAAPPHVELEQASLWLEGPPGAALEGTVVVQTSERRPVFAHAVAAEPWLSVGRAVLNGRKARIPVRVAAVPGRPGEQLHGQINVTANGFQRFTVPVTLTVTAAAPAPPIRRQTPSSWGGPTTAHPEYEETRPSRRPGLLAWAIAGAFLILAMGLVAAVTVVICLSPSDGPDAAAPVAQASAAAPVEAAPPIADGKRPNDPPPPPPLPPPPPKQPELSDIVKLLDSDDPPERIAAARRLGALGPAAAPALHALLQAMKPRDDAFRREALLALPKIGAPTAADADVLGDLADEAAFPEGRRYAVDALAALGPDAKPARQGLCGALRDRDAAIRRQAAAVLGNIGPDPRGTARDALIVALRDADAAVAAAATAALGKMGPPTLADGPSLEVLLQDKAAPARRFALNAFRDLGPDAADFAPYLEDSVDRDALPELRRLAVTALVKVAPTARRTAEACTRALADKDVEVGRAAVAALAQMGVEHGATAGLVQALASDDEATGKAAMDALMGAKLNEAQVRSLGEALRSKNLAPRLRILELLKPLGVDAAPAVPGLCAVLKDGPGEARQTAFAVLTAMGPAAHQASPALDDLVKDDKFAVRLDAAVALAAIEGSDAEEAAPALIEALQVEKIDDATQAADRQRAVEALGRIGEPAVKPLAAALEGDFASGSPETLKGQINIQARLAAVKALGLIGVRANDIKTQILLSKLQRNDVSQSVRDAAKQARALIRKGGG